MSILAEIAAYTRQRIEGERVHMPDTELIRDAQALPADTGFPFEEALSAQGLSFICEVKKASPSKGVIAEDFHPADIARAYEQAGASAISVLTEPRWFRGSACHLREVASVVGIPVLRKDFIVDARQIYEAKLLGASAVLLICAILRDDDLRHFRELADSLGLSALVEAHDADEIRRGLEAGARIIGVNNRDLKTFEIDRANSLRLRALVPEDVLFVSESGVSSGEDVKVLSEARPDALLIGEAMMRSEDKKGLLQSISRFSLPPKPAAAARTKTADSVADAAIDAAGDATADTATRTKLKICGLTRAEDVQAVNAAGVDYAGFVFAEKSRRFVSKETARILRAQLAPGILAVGVFAGAEISEIAALAEDGIIDIAQLHGIEDEDYIASLRRRTIIPIIRALSVTSRENLAHADRSDADFLMLDHGSGGTGQSFDWEILRGLRPGKPWFLAGGICADNVEAALRLKPYAIDVSSGVETDGYKDPAKMMEIARIVRNYDSEQEMTAEGKGENRG